MCFLGCAVCSCISWCVHDVLVRKCWQLEGCQAVPGNWIDVFRTGVPGDFQPVISMFTGKYSNSRSRPHNRSPSDNRTWIWMLPHSASKKLKGRVVTCKTSKYQLRTSNDHSGKETKPNKHDAVWNPFPFIPCPIREATFGPEVTTFFKRKTTVLRGDEIWQLHRLICS